MGVNRNRRCRRPALIWLLHNHLGVAWEEDFVKMAKHNRGEHIVAKTNYEDSHKKLIRAGADHVLSPSKLAADRALTKFMLPAVDELIVIGPEGGVNKLVEHFAEE